MNEKDIIKAAMKTCGWTQKELAAQSGYNTQSAISNRLGGRSMRVDTFVKLLSAMGYEVVVQSTSRNTNKNKWVVSNEEQVSSIDTDTKVIDLDKLLATDETTVKSTNGKIKLR